jgi:TorA maturation chaperone TorD
MRDRDLQEIRRAPGRSSEAESKPRSQFVDEIDQARAREYALLSTLLRRSPDAGMISRLARLGGDATPLGVAHAALANAAGRVTADEVEREYFDLFAGLRPGGLFPYASHYLTGALQGRPLARLREALRHFGIERTPEETEPEDHAAFLCAIMSGFAEARFAASAGADREIFEEHLGPWIRHFFTDLEKAERADFYAAVGGLGRAFIAIEQEAFALPG